MPKEAIPHTTGDGLTLVASKRPPSPTSTTATSTSSASMIWKPTNVRKRKKAGRVGCASVDAAQSLSQTSQKCRKKSSSETGLPLMQIRSLTSTRCGEVYLCAAPQRLRHFVICCTPRDTSRLSEVLQSSLQPVRTQDRFSERARRPLPLGPGYVNHFKLVQLQSHETCCKVLRTIVPKQAKIGLHAPEARVSLRCRASGRGFADCRFGLIAVR